MLCLHLTLSTSQIENLKCIQGEAVCHFGCAWDTSIVCILTLPLVYERYKVLQPKMYVKFATGSKHLLYEVLVDSKRLPCSCGKCISKALSEAQKNFEA